MTLHHNVSDMLSDTRWIKTTLDHSVKYQIKEALYDGIYSPMMHTLTESASSFPSRAYVPKDQQGPKYS